MTDLDSQLAAIEAIAERNGFGGTRRPELSRDQVNDLEIQFQRPLPSDLRTVLEWYDPTLWSWFVNPERRKLSDRKIYGTGGGLITPGHPEDEINDWFGLDPSAVAFHCVATSQESHLRRVRDNVLIENERSADWLDAEFIRIGWGTHFEAFYYTISSPAWPCGSVVVGIDDDCHLYWTATTLATWFARLVACDGNEYSFGIVSDGSPNDLEMAFILEWNRENPSCSWWDRYR
ncbi:MAG TPA: hypothetical protein VF777_05390 [Phycisphaerales bacterium]